MLIPTFGTRTSHHDGITPGVGVVVPADGLVGVRVVVVRALAVGEFPEPATRTAVGDEHDDLAGTTCVRHFCRDEPGALADIIGVGLRERVTSISTATNGGNQRAEIGEVAHDTILFSEGTTFRFRLNT